MKKMETNRDGIYLTIDDAKHKYNFSRPILMKVGEEANAVLRIGRMVRIDAAKLEKFVQEKYCG